MRAVSSLHVPAFRASAQLLVAGLVVVGCGQATLPVIDEDLIGTTTVPSLAGTETASDLGSAIDPEPSAAGETSDADAGAIPQNASFTTGDEWRDVTSNLEGLESTCGNVSYLSVDPDDGAVIAGISANGLWEWRSDSGAWEPLGDGGGSDTILNRTAWIEYDPQATETFWEAGTYGDGVFRTDDGGVTFRQLGDVQSVDSVSVDLTDPDRTTMLAGAHEMTALYLSLDGGDSWVDIAVGLPDDIGFTSFALVLGPQTLMVGSYRGSSAGIYRSDNRGLTWTQVLDLPVAGNAIRTDDAIYWLLENGRGVAVSRDDGQTFEVGAPTGGAPLVLNRLSDGTLVTHAGQQMLVSENDGATWDPVGPTLPFEPRGVTVTETGDAAYAWQFTCNFDEAGNPVLPMSIVELDFAEA